MLVKFFKDSHCVKSVRIRSYSGPHFSRIFPHLDWSISPYSVKANENPGCSVEARVILEIYSSYLANENLPQESNITRFGKMIL